MNYKSKQELKKLISLMLILLLLLITVVIILIKTNETTTLEGVISNKTENSVYITTVDGSDWELENPSIKNNLLIGTKVNVILDTMGTEEIVDDNIIYFQIIKERVE